MTKSAARERVFPTPLGDLENTLVYGKCPSQTSVKQCNRFVHLLVLKIGVFAILSYQLVNHQIANYSIKNTVFEISKRRTVRVLDSDVGVEFSPPPVLLRGIKESKGGAPGPPPTPTDDGKFLRLYIIRGPRNHSRAAS